ncbi:MAG: hypothetical protein U5K54_18000 [Cytophagales bacterium]|nr:hypothetical protein [Cytophagales bacterium]
MHPVKELEKSIYFQFPTTSMKNAVRDKNKSGIIAEIKRKSPSKGVINAQVFVEHIANGYFKAGASAISVLTDLEFFGGSNERFESGPQEHPRTNPKKRIYY